MLGSAQLAGSHCGEWGPEAATDTLCPGDFGPAPLPTSSPSTTRSAGLLLYLHADPLQPGVPRGNSSWKNLLEQDLPARVAMGDPVCPGIPVLLFTRGHCLGSDIHSSLTVWLLGQDSLQGT